MYSKKINLLSSAALLVVAACSGNTPDATGTTTPDIGGTAAAIVQTQLPAALTQVALDNEANATTPPTVTATISAALLISPAPTDFESSEVCLAAIVVSETPPDDTVVAAGHTYEKTWWLRNTGECAWTDEFSFVFDRGNTMGAAERIAFPGYVAPGQSIPFILNLIAPAGSGTHVGFWKMEGSDGTVFGVGENGGVPFWVQIVVPGPAPTPKVSTRGPQTWGNIRSDGKVGDTVEVGDNGSNLGYQGYMTFDFGNLPTSGSIVFVVLDIGQGVQMAGDPFTDLGCLNVFADNYPGVLLWRFCSLAELKSGAYGAGGPDAIAAFDHAFSSGSIRLTFSFDNTTNSDGDRDSITIRETILRVDYIP
ncbi:MAG: NBR1-Ig-like domain-containing protein [Chloroflexota bacterium]